MKKLWVTGAGGFLGRTVCLYARNIWDITATYRSHPNHVPGVALDQLDLTSYFEVKRHLKSLQPDAVVHTAAASDLDHCQKHPSESRKINVDAAVQLADLCSDESIPFVFTSSDMVFDGANPPYKEVDPLCPINKYGEQKARAEEDILARYPRATICRLPLMYGFHFSSGRRLFKPKTLPQIKTEIIHLFVDEFRTPLSVESAASGLLLALKKVRGILHLGGPERISRYELGRRIFKQANGDESQLMPVYQKEVRTASPRPADVSLDSSKSESIGFYPPSLNMELTRLFDENYTEAF